MSKTIKNLAKNLAFATTLVLGGGFAANPAMAHDNDRAHYGKSTGMVSVVYHYRDRGHTYPLRRPWRRMIRLVRAGRMACFHNVRVRGYRGDHRYGHDRRVRSRGYGPRYHRVRLGPRKLRRLVRAGFGPSIRCRPAYLHY